MAQDPNVFFSQSKRATLKLRLQYGKYCTILEQSGCGFLYVTNKC